MSEADRSRGKRIAAQLATLSEEQRASFTQKQIDESNRQHADFIAAFHAGACYLCGRALESFDKGDPCVHWLLRPDGFKKKHFPEITKKYGAMQMQAWLRWVATTDAIARNIVDAGGENGNDKLLEVTIKYRRFTWSFSCRASDFEGHKLARVGNTPHYHFQMRIDDRPFINYNDFHPRLHRGDIVGLEMLRNSKGVVKSVFLHGLSIDDVLTEENLETIIDLPMDHSDDPETGAFSIQTMIMADPGTTIRGEDIYDMIQSARAKGVSIASQARDFKGANVRVMVGEGPGVIAPEPRTPRGGEKD